MAAIKIPLPFTVDLNKGDPRRTLEAPMVLGNNMAHELAITVMRGKEPADLSGAACYGYGVIKPNGMTVLISGTVSGNMAKLTLPQACYAYVGHLDLVVSISQGNAVTTVLYLGCTVLPGATDAVIDPDDIVPSLEELLALIAAMKAEILAAQAATTNATSAAATANTAAQDANAATENANAATDAASNAAYAIDGMTVRAEGLPAGAEATAVITEQAGVKHIDFGIPKGDPGVVTELGAGLFAMHVDGNGHLIMTYNDGDGPPPLEIGEDGHLHYMFE